RRYSPPKAVSARRTDEGGPKARNAHVQIFRPMLGYPDIVFSDFPDAVALLAAQAAEAEAERREPALPDPDATQVRIDVEVRTLARDPEATDATAQPFVRVFSAVRDFPEDPAEPIELDIAFTDMVTLGQLRDNPAAAGDPLLLPSARSVRLVFTPV